MPAKYDRRSMASHRLLTRVCEVIGKPRLLRWTRRAAHLSRVIANKTHLLLFYVHWGVPPAPEWQDQFTSMYMMWERLRQAFWVERGCATLLALAENDRILELCCGDGFYTRYFYSGRGSRVTAVDFSSDAIAYAREYNSAPNITYELGDIREGLPEGEFDAVVWNGAIEHFTPKEIDEIVAAIRERLRPGGILCGYTVAAVGDDIQLVHHEYEFRSKEDLLRFLTPRFANAKVFETVWPAVPPFPEGGKRHNLYFFASDGVLPFDDEWSAVVRSTLDAVRGAPAIDL